MEIQLTELGLLSSATVAFLEQSENMTQLIPTSHPFFSIENAIAEKTNFPVESRKILVDTLKNQYTRLDINTQVLVNQNIESLLDANTYTIATGQQLHLFLGPAFMVYKLISAIKAAEHYQQKYPSKKFVPLFWLASEDHDFDEIKNTHLFGQTYEWKTEQSGACGTYHLKDLPRVFEQLKLKLASDGKALQLISEFEQIYSSSENLSDATIKLTHHLFGQYGLLCLDANNHLLKNLFKSVILDEVIHQKSEQEFNTFSTLMADNELSLQLKSRPINLFYLKDNIRARLEFKDGKYIVNNTSTVFTEEELIAEINATPERFSPNAVLRPLFQELVLPNVAYIGGNAEINYWLQLTKVFELYNVTAPTLILRQSAWLIKAKQQEWLDSKAINIKDLFNIKTELDKISKVSSNQIFNPLEDLLERFTALKNEALDIAGKDALKSIKELAEISKQYEKIIKELIKAKNEQYLEKNKKDLIKLEQFISNGFGKNSIQERKTYAIEFLINIPDYINFCMIQLKFSKGTGYFLNM